MIIPVFIQQIAGKGYLARAGSPFDWSAEGATEEESLKNLQNVAMKCIVDGCKITSITVPDLNDPLAKAKANGMVIEPPQGEHLLSKWAGTLPDDELTAMFRSAVEDYRREIDTDPNRCTSNAPIAGFD
jgi:predicted RNase H-like HicB family nuclease